MEKESERYQELVKWAQREVNAGNERMRPYLEAYANHRDALKIKEMEEQLDEAAPEQQGR
jgi:hypothetical protein